MANTVTGASLSAVYGRLNSAPRYHPFEADTFADWSVEAGDVITVKRGEKEYNSPVCSSKLVWKGTPNVMLSSTGQKERDSISKTSKKKYRGGSGGMRSQQGLYYDFYSEDGYLHSALEMTESHMRTSFEDGLNSLRSVVEQTASYWRSTLEDTANSLRSTVEQTASRWEAKIEGVVDEDGNVTAASIAVSINEAGEGEAHIDANKVYIGNDKSTTVIAGKTTLSEVESTYFTTQYLNAKIGEIPTLNGIAASFTGNVSCSGLLASQVYVGGAGGYTNISNGVSYVQLTGPVDNVYTLRVTKFDGTYENYNFNRATTDKVSGTWSGGVYTVSADANGQALPISTAIGKYSQSWDENICTVYVGWENPISGTMISTGCHFNIDATDIYTNGRNDTNVSATPEWEHAAPYDGTSNSVTHTTDAPNPVAGSSKVMTLHLTQDSNFTNNVKHVYMRTGSTAGNIRAQIEVDASSVYTTGYNNGRPVSGTAGGRTSGVSGLVHDFSITKGDGTSATLQIDCTSIYNTARSGYTYGTFTQQTITLQGSPTSSLTLQGQAATKTQVTLQGSATSSLTLQGAAQTVYETVSSGGTMYYQAGAAINVYPGNGGQKTAIGTKQTITKQGTARYFKLHQQSEAPTGSWYSMHTTKPSSGSIVTVYLPGTTVELYEKGSTFYARGSAQSITPISSSGSLQLKSVQRYKAGQNVGILYNAGSIAEYYPATQTLYKAGTNIGVLYNAGTVSNDYYLKT